MGTKLYVGNLPFETTDEQLKDTFSQAGEVAEANVIRNKFSGKSRGFGFVQMADQAGATKACEQFNNTDFGGRNIVVNEARPLTERSDRDNRGGRGGYRGGRDRDRGDRRYG